MKASEELRNDPAARAAAREMILRTDAQMAEVIETLTSLLEVQMQDWYSPDPRAGVENVKHEARHHVWIARDRLIKIRRIGNRGEDWPNETYIGNVAAFGGRE